MSATRTPACTRHPLRTKDMATDPEPTIAFTRPLRCIAVFARKGDAVTFLRSARRCVMSPTTDGRYAVFSLKEKS